MEVVSSDTMDEKLEEIEDSFEDLLIFPTRKGLRRSMEMIEAYFALEVEMMRQWGLQNGRHYQSTMEDQQAILNIARNELGNRARGLPATACESC